MAGVQANIRTFIAPLEGPGRTAPVFLEDLTLYDIRNRLPSDPDILRDPCLDFLDAEKIGDFLPEGSCQHAFVIKPRQTKTPALDERPSSDSVYIVSALCKHCRTHVHLKVDYTIRWEEGPCPNADNPLHHLVPSPWRETVAQNEWSSKNEESTDKVHVFECSSPTCSATVLVRFQPPWLTDQDVHTLLDKDLLRQRTEEAFRTNAGHVEGMRYPTPMDVLVDLQRYLVNSWTREQRTISVDNKRFVVRFGPEGTACKDVLYKLKFRFEDQPQKLWEVPKPNLDEEEPFQDPLNVFMDDVEHELGVLISQRPKEERGAGQEAPVLNTASVDFARSLGCQDYDKTLVARTLTISPASRPRMLRKQALNNVLWGKSPYTVLGVPANVSDGIIIHGYEKQKATKPASSPYFLTALEEVNALRPSETLETHIATEISEGKFDSQSLRQAYSYFGLNFKGQQTDDDHIIGIFRSRVEDAPMHEIDMRENLRIIGEHRQSRKIVDFANNSLNTYDQALAYLGGSATTTDEFIETLYTSKVVEDTNAAQQARKAVEIVAEHRKSTALKTWLETGQLGESSMDEAEAYRALQIPDRMTADDMVLSAYQVAISDNTTNVEYYNRALIAIAKGRNSAMLLTAIGGKAITTTDIGSADNPVGLENIGNTCYLNSLLQFLFTLTELRNIVLHFDQYKMDLSSADVAKKRVGRRHVTVQEVGTAQKFAASLADLFQDMITSPASSVTPKQELARLTLESEDAKQRVKRRSTIASGGRPSLGHIDSLPVQGPLLPPVSETNGVTNEDVVMSPIDFEDVFNDMNNKGASSHEAGMSNTTTTDFPGFEDTKMTDGDDNSSEATLVSKPSSVDEIILPEETADQQKKILENKENFATKGHDNHRRSQSPEKHMAPLSQVSSSVLNSQAGVLSQKPNTDSTEMEGVKQPEETKYLPPPGRPPPVPPRPKQPVAMNAIEEYARQQDVTEVISHCLFLLSCAIRPLGTDQDGEQLDEIHNLFSGQVRYHDVPDKGSQNDAELFSSIITRLYSQPEDIYDALDTYFDLEEVENGRQRFASIAQLPPVVAIQLDRVAFDSKTQSYKKLSHHVKLHETIFLDRYLETDQDSALMQRRRDTWNMKKELAQKQERARELEPMPNRPEVYQVFEDARDILDSLQTIDVDDMDDDLQVEPDVVDTLDTLASQTRAEHEDLKVSTVDLRQSITSNFTDLRRHPYRLHAAFFHHGTQGAGHYWVYIYDATREIWRKYNDGYVTVVNDLNEIFGRPPDSEYRYAAGPANPYLLIYVREDKVQELVSPVCREIVEVGPPEGPPPGHQEEDVEMQEQPQAGAGLDADVPNGAYVPIMRQMGRVGDWDDTSATGDW